MGCSASAESQTAHPSDVVVEQPTGLTSNQLDRVKSLFADFDIDSKGSIKISDLSGAVVKVGPIESNVLSQLKAMDFNGDGTVDADEWQQFFEATAGTLSASEFDVIMKDLSEAGIDMITVLKCTRLAASAATDATAPTSADDAALAELPASRKAAVEALFDAWDFGGEGRVNLSKVASASLQIGPREDKILSDLATMDVDHDGFVTKEEMLQFFGAASPMLSDGEFDQVTSEMSELAHTAKNIAEMLALAAAPVTVSADESALPPLSEARAQLVKELYLKYAPSVEVAIDLSRLQGDCKTEIGPSKHTLLESLAAMDANGDSLVVYDEMVSYFNAVGSVLSDDEFDATLSELASSAAMAQLVRMVE